MQDKQQYRNTGQADRASHGSACQTSFKNLACSCHAEPPATTTYLSNTTRQYACRMHMCTVLMLVGCLVLPTCCLQVQGPALQLPVSHPPRRNTGERLCRHACIKDNLRSSYGGHSVRAHMCAIMGNYSGICWDLHCSGCLFSKQVPQEPACCLIWDDICLCLSAELHGPRAVQCKVGPGEAPDGCAHALLGQC
jgi:hypothetical protein